MTSVEKLGMMFKERTNKFNVNITSGEVVSVSPLKIKWGEDIIIESKKIILANLISSGFVVEYTDSTGTGSTTKTITIKNPLKVNDKVIMVPDDDFNMWYVIDKVG